MKYSQSHEWIKLTNNNAIVGLSAVAIKGLGKIIFIDLPKLGQEVTPDDPICVIESAKAAIDIYSPVSGKVVKINTALQANPSVLSDSPEDKGWLFEIQMINDREYANLLSEEEYLKLKND